MNYFFLVGLVTIFSILSCTNTLSGSKEPNYRWTINQTNVGIIEIGESILQIKQELMDSITIQEHGHGTLGFDIVDGTDILIKVYELDKKVGAIEIYSDRFSIKNGIKTGMTIEEIEKIYSNFIPSMDPHNGRVYFKPEELQSNKSSCTIYFVKNDDSPVWNFTKKTDGEHFIYEPQGKIDKKSVVETIIIQEIK